MKNSYQKRDAVKNYFPLPNELFCLGLSSGEILVYTYLMYCEDRKTYQCHPSYKTIGKAVGMTRNTVRKYAQMLEERHLIMTEPTKVVTKSGVKRNGSLLYTVLPIDEAVRFHNEEQLRRLEAENAKARAKKALEEYDKAHPKEAP